MNDQTRLRKLLGLYATRSDSTIGFPTELQLEKYGDIAFQNGEYKLAHDFYGDAYDKQWQESERMLNKQKELGNAPSDSVIDDNQILVNIQSTQVVNEI